MCQGILRKDRASRFVSLRLELATIEQHVTFALDHFPFLLQEARHCLTKSPIDEVMRARGRLGIQSAQLFETATGASFESLPAVADEMLDGGIVADIEMEKGAVFKSTPIATVQYTFAANI